MRVFKTPNFVAVLFPDYGEMEKDGVAVSQDGPFEFGFKGPKFFLQEKNMLILSGKIIFQVR